MSTVESSRRLPCWIAAFGVLLLAVSGCSESRDWAPVSGRVTLDGEPQEGIFVYFEPELPAGADPLKGLSKSYARTDADGQYTLMFMDVDKDRPGALVGPHIVTADDERTFNDNTVTSRVPRGWKAEFDVPQNGSSIAEFDLSEK